MKLKGNYLLLLVVVFCLVSRALSANCTTLIQDYITYLKTSDPGYSRYVTFQMSSMKASARYVGFSSGSLSVLTYRTVSYLYAKDAKTVFSDRTWCPQLPKGDIFCTGYQKFDYQRADTFQMSLFPNNSTAKIVLSSWGNATYSFPLQCKNGFMYGSMKQPNGNSFMTISMKKDRYQIPK